MRSVTIALAVPAVAKSSPSLFLRSPRPSHSTCRTGPGGRSRSGRPRRASWRRSASASSPCSGRDRRAPPWSPTVPNSRSRQRKRAQSAARSPLAAGRRGRTDPGNLGFDGAPRGHRRGSILATRAIGRPTNATGGDWLAVYPPSRMNRYAGGERARDSPVSVFVVERQGVARAASENNWGAWRQLSLWSAMPRRSARSRHRVGARVDPSRREGSFPRLPRASPSPRHYDSKMLLGNPHTLVAGAGIAWSPTLVRPGDDLDLLFVVVVDHTPYPSGDSGVALASGTSTTSRSGPGISPFMLLPFLSFGRKRHCVRCRPRRDSRWNAPR